MEQIVTVIIEVLIVSTILIAILDKMLRDRDSRNSEGGRTQVKL